MSPTSAATLSFNGLATAPAGVTIEAARVVDGRVVQGYDSLSTSRSRGMGVVGAGDTGEADGTDQIDSYDGEDVIVFRFDRPVRLERIDFALIDWWDRFDLYIGDEAALQRPYKADDLSGYDWVSSIAVDGSPVARTFAVAASRYQSCGYAIGEGHACWWENSAFRLTGLRFSDVEPDAVPLPSSFALSIGGLAALVLLRRRHIFQG
ncbi:VPLPA-CTERM sorting domain-containing protein [Silicimonas algicola]|nr:VPLPA-CTERM sorting domain-containing protein [Silicimonas algicola]